MKSGLIWGAIGTVAVITAAFFAGRASVGERVREVPVTVTVEKVTTDWVKARRDSITINELLATNSRLRGMRPDTVLISLPGDPTFVDISSLDTVIHTNSSGKVVLNGDTVSVSVPSSVTVSVQYLGEPFHAFRFPEIAVSPFTVSVPVVERVVETGNFSFAVEPVLGAGPGGAVYGGLARVGNIGLGAVGSEHGPIYLASYRLVIF